MKGNELLILKGHEVLSLLAGQEAELLQIVRRTYEAHARQEDSLPHSIFLRFPDNDKNRIIGLPAYLGNGFAVAGIKWISSFPGNHALGLDRASAAIVLNSTRTGRPEAILEGSIVSAKRTAASAALAAQFLHGNPEEEDIGVVGCGLINFEVVKFLLTVFPRVQSLSLFDTNPEHGRQFQLKCRQRAEHLTIEIAEEARNILDRCSLISIATTAAQPHLTDLSMCRPGGTILHVSLRDLAPEVILACENVVDDIDHVCRAQTSLHLAEQLVGHRAFIKCTLADITMGNAQARSDPRATVVFSPFGLGVLDLAVSKYVMDLAIAQNRGTIIESFLPQSWLESA
jgi:2,3-diaminopropionate biosynthesis protein SbnB